MRIISGVAKGMRLNGPPAKSMSIRPTSDRSREALFSILADRLANSHVLDLFAGTGALGLEALSRGASSAVFVDNANTSLAILKKNISSFQYALGPDAKDISVIKADIGKNLNSLNQRLSDQTFDIIFLDPPYDKGLALGTLKHLANLHFLRKDGLIIAEERTTNDLPETLDSLTRIDRRQYGDTGFWFYTEEGTSL